MLELAAKIHDEASQGEAFASYKNDPDAIYTSRVFTFNNLTKPINSSIITSYLNEEEENNKGVVFKIFLKYLLL